MANSCPDCGAPMDFEQRDVRLRSGTCPSCAKEFAFLEGSTVSSRLGTPTTEPASEAENDEGEGEEKVAGEGPECGECGSPLSIREGADESLELSCPDCGTTAVYVPKRESTRPAREERSRGRPDSEGPRSRPCRQCGAPLRFSTAEDGGVVGECDSCGNRFTLPPRDDRRGGGGFRGKPSYGRRDYRSGPRGRPYNGGRGGTRGGRPYRDSERRSSPRDEDDRRKRRRRDD